MNEEKSDAFSWESTVIVTPAGDNAASADSAPKPASFLKATASFAQSMAKFAASGFKVVDEKSHSLRMNHCNPCEYRQNTRCTLCWCFIDKKAWLPHEDCPIGRWPA
jgi:hypothetical protein